MVAIGNTDVPKLTASLNFGAMFKGFDIDLQWQGVQGRSVYLSGDRYQALQNTRNIPAMALDRWTPETAETAAYPRLSAINNSNNFRTSSFWQKDGSFIKLRSIELGYSLPQQWISVVGLEHLRVFVNGTNLFSIDGIKHSDPELFAGYPVTKTWSVGLKVKF